MSELIAAIVALLVAIGVADPGYEVAVRGEQEVVVDTTTTTTTTVPPPPTDIYGSESPGRCTQYEYLLEFFNPGWDVDQFSKIMYRESRCQPDAANSCCTGLVQIHRLHIPNLGVCGVFSREDLMEPDKNICAAAVVFGRAGGTSPWSQTR